MPKLKMSVRVSTRSPRACSGDIYCAVPITTPGTVSFDGPGGIVANGSSVSDRSASSRMRSAGGGDLDSFARGCLGAGERGGARLLGVLWRRELGIFT